MIVENGREVIIRVRGLAKKFGTQQIWDGLSLEFYFLIKPFSNAISTVL